MKSTTKLFVCASFLLAGFSANALAQCADFTYYPLLGDKFGGWSTPEGVEVINLKASTLTDSNKYPRTGAVDGQEDNVDWESGQMIRAPYGSGTIDVPLYDYDETTEGVKESGKTYSITFHNCVFAPDHNTSAYAKVDWGESASGTNDPCTLNDGTVLNNGMFNKVGFVELNRKGNDANAPGGLGYIQLDGLYAVEKIQWSFSATSWKRGVKCEVKKGDGNWELVRSLPSDIGNGTYGTFAEQGYLFEENLNMVEDTETPVSIRFRIWDGDTLTFAKELDLLPEERSKDYFYVPENPKGTWQAVRIHDIKVYSGLNGSDIADKVATNVAKNELGSLYIYKSENEICVSEDCNAKIYTIDGNLVKEFNGTSINVSDLNKGVYIVRAQSVNGAAKTVKVAL